VLLTEALVLRNDALVHVLVLRDGLQVVLLQETHTICMLISVVCVANERSAGSLSWLSAHATSRLPFCNFSSCCLALAASCWSR